MGTQNPTARDRLVAAGTELFRVQGYVGTSVEQICQAAGVTKGAFFHHFKSKEALCEACLAAWDDMTCLVDDGAPYQAIEEPTERLLAMLDFWTGMITDPDVVKSCLAGTTAQEVSETNPALRDAAGECFMNAERRLRLFLDAAAADRGLALDTGSLAALWTATIQGALLRYKATRDGQALADTPRHVRDYFESLLAAVP